LVPVALAAVCAELHLRILAVRLSQHDHLPGEMAAPDTGQGRRLRVSNLRVDLVAAAWPDPRAGSRQPQCGTEGIFPGAASAHLFRAWRHHPLAAPPRADPSHRSLAGARADRARATLIGLFRVRYASDLIREWKPCWRE